MVLLILAGIIVGAINWLVVRPRRQFKAAVLEYSPRIEHFVSAAFGLYNTEIQVDDPVVILRAPRCLYFKGAARSRQHDEVGFSGVYDIEQHKIAASRYYKTKIGPHLVWACSRWNGGEFVDYRTEDAPSAYSTPTIDCIPLRNVVKLPPLISPPVGEPRVTAQNFALIEVGTNGTDRFALDDLLGEPASKHGCMDPRFPNCTERTYRGSNGVTITVILENDAVTVSKSIRVPQNAPRP